MWGWPRGVVTRQLHISIGERPLVHTVQSRKHFHRQVKYYYVLPGNHTLYVISFVLVFDKLPRLKPIYYSCQRYRNSKVLTYLHRTDKQSTHFATVSNINRIAWTVICLAVWRLGVLFSILYHNLWVRARFHEPLFYFLSLTNHWPVAALLLQIGVLCPLLLFSSNDTPLLLFLVFSLCVRSRNVLVVLKRLRHDTILYSGRKFRVNRALTNLSASVREQSG